MANQTIIIPLLLITIFYKASGDAKSPSPAPSLPFPWLPTPLSPSYPPSPAASVSPSPSPSPDLTHVPQPSSSPAPPSISVIRGAYWPAYMSWTFPATAIDTTYFTHEAAATSSRRLLLTAAVYFAAEFILADNRSYPATSIRKNVDWVNALCFDYHGTWDTSVTGAHAALYDPMSNVSTSFGLPSWVSAGVPAGKVVIGLPLYGRTWQLRDPAEHGVGAPAVGVGPGGGLMQFKDLMDYNVENNATGVYDGITVSTYSY
ncbi:hypothetical protein MRB53_017911 [Persea americana]|uniref:Uncharacterized protein n=3 Tax=Persea americana TaxID=3435 RepID=A0ACC2M6A7_PERAE|nr:hypothetical protein MRB53_017908 [Persea americana]KAJ8641217.1 hypothetical protein MRB53_017911 [Persea americana]